MNAFAQKCIELRKEDHTLNEIMKITGRSKTSVYQHIKSIPLSNDKRKEISRNTAMRIANYNHSQKGTSRRSFNKFTTWDTGRVRLISHLLFDGQITNSSCIYHNRSEALISCVSEDILSVYQYPPKTSENWAGVTRISYHNVALAQYLKEKSQELLSKVFDMEHGFQRTFLQAFFDDEGCVGYDPDNKTRRVRGYQHDHDILELIQKLLNNFDIDSTIRYTGNEIVISRRSNLDKFQEHINFSSGVRVNGSRSNSRWGESLEKREILQHAVESYQ